MSVANEDLNARFQTTYDELHTELDREWSGQNWWCKFMFDDRAKMEDFLEELQAWTTEKQALCLKPNVEGSPDAHTIAYVVQTSVADIQAAKVLLTTLEGVYEQHVQLESKLAPLSQMLDETEVLYNKDNGEMPAVLASLQAVRADLQVWRAAERPIRDRYKAYGEEASALMERFHARKSLMRQLDRANRSSGAGHRNKHKRKRETTV